MNPTGGDEQGMTRTPRPRAPGRRALRLPPAREPASRGGRRAPAAILALALAAAPALALPGCAAHAPPQTGPAVATADYVIGPGDVLDVFVYRSPDLSATLPVRPDGRISVPLVPDVQAAGLTPTQLGKELQQRLEKYVKDPNVTVMVTGFNGPFDKQIKVVGEAVQPLAIPYRDHMTLLDVMIEAKGLTRYAAGNRAEIVRGNGANRKVIPVRVGDLLRDGDVSQNLEMRPGDTLIIPQTWF